MSYPIQKADICDVPRIARLLDQVFAIQNRDPEALIAWKFFADYQARQTILYSARNKTGDFISQYANIPIGLRFNNQGIRGMVCADMATHPAYRGQGLISELARHVYRDVVNDGFDVSIGYSNAQGVQVDRNASGYGYTIVGRFQRYVRPLLRKLPTPYTLSVHHADQPLVAPMMCQREALFQIDKSASYLTWRYLQKPHQDYRLCDINCDGVAIGTLIWRLVAGRIYLYDLIIDRALYDLADVIQAAINFFLECDKHSLFLYVLDNSSWRKLLLRNGWIAIPTPLRKDHYYLTVKAHKFHDSALYNPASWWLIAGIFCKILY